MKEDPLDKSKCRCIACNATLTCGKSELDKHAAGKKHIINLKSIVSTNSLNTLFQTPKSNPIEKKVKTAEIKLANFFIEHNVAFQIVEFNSSS